MKSLHISMSIILMIAFLTGCKDDSSYQLESISFMWLCDVNIDGLNIVRDNLCDAGFSPIFGRCWESLYPLAVPVDQYQPAYDYIQANGNIFNSYDVALINSTNVFDVTKRDYEMITTEESW